MIGLKYLPIYLAAFCLVVNVGRLPAVDDSERTQDEILKEEAIAKFEKFALDMEGMESTAFVCVGTILSIQSEQRFSGIFPFVTFRAHKFGELTKLRFWIQRSQTMDPRFVLGGFGEADLQIGNDEWYSRMGSPPQKISPDVERHPLHDAMKIDPRYAVLSLAGALETGAMDGNRSIPYFSAAKIASVEKQLGGLLVEFSYRGSTYVFFDETQGDRPTKACFLREGQQLDAERNNAFGANRMQWKQNADGFWMPQSGSNTYYFRGTKKESKGAKTIEQKYVWIEDSQLPETVFEVDSLTTSISDMRRPFEKWIALAEEIEPVSAAQ